MGKEKLQMSTDDTRHGELGMNGLMTFLPLWNRNLHSGKRELLANEICALRVPGRTQPNSTNCIAY